MDKNRTLRFLDGFTKWAFYLLAAAVTFSNSFTEIATTIIIISWLTRRFLERDNTLPGGIVSRFFLLFAVWNVASFMNTDFIYESIRGFFKVVKHLFLFLAAVDSFRSRKRLKEFLFFALGCGFIISLNGIVQYITGMDPIRQRIIDPLDYLHRTSSSFKHPNDFAAYLIIVLTILLSLFFSKTSPLKEKALLLFAILPVAWCLVNTDSRGGWMGFIIGLLCLAAMKSKRLLAAILILLVVSPVLLPGSIKGRFSDFATMGTQGTVWERTRLWAGTLAMVKTHPFLGFGVNTYTRNFTAYKPKDYPDVRYTHNSYLHMAAEIGVVGAGIFLVFLAALMVSSARAISRFERGLERNLSLGLFAGTIGFLAHCAVDTHFYSVTLSAFLFLCLGLLIALRNLAYGGKVANTD